MTPRGPQLEQIARFLLGPDIAVAHCPVGQGSSGLFPDEAAAISRAIPARRDEFAAGRHAARTAMVALGRAAVSIPMAPDRAPEWPAGLTGSITHADGLALAAIAPLTHVRAIGLDLEKDAPLDGDLWQAILLDQERAWLETLPEPRRAQYAMRIFSAKEAVYKAQYPVTGAFLEFTDITISYGENDDAFSAEFMVNARPFTKGTSHKGRQTLAAGMILSLLRI